MTPAQIALVQESFKKALPIADAAADIFCDCLLATAPELRAAWRETYEPVVGVMKRAPATEPA